LSNNSVISQKTLIFKVVLYMNHAGLVWPANAEPHSSTADTEPSIPTPDAGIWWTDAVLSSRSAAGTQANMGAAGTVTTPVSTAGRQDAVGWSTFSKVSLAAFGESTQPTYTLYVHALALESIVVNLPCAHFILGYHNIHAPHHGLFVIFAWFMGIY
jgi:hypothetical protein